MDSGPRLPLAGRIVGLALAILAVGIALRVLWELLLPLTPTVLSLLGIMVVYGVMFGRFRKK